MIEQFVYDYKILLEPDMQMSHKMFLNKYYQLFSSIIQNQLISHDNKEIERKVIYFQAYKKNHCLI